MRITDVGERIKAWYRPANELDTARRDQLITWLATARPGINHADLPIAVLLRDPELEAVRLEAIKDLKIP